MVQEPAPERPIAGGLATPALLGPGTGQQILRSHTGLSAVADLCPPWHRSLTFDAGRMGRRCLLVARFIASALVTTATLGGLRSVHILKISKLDCECQLCKMHVCFWRSISPVAYEVFQCCMSIDNAT